MSVRGLHVGLTTHNSVTTYHNGHYGLQLIMVLQTLGIRWWQVQSSSHIITIQIHGKVSQIVRLISLAQLLVRSVERWLN